MRKLRDKLIRFLKWIKKECGNKETIILFAVVVVVMYAPVWGGYLLYAVFGWKWCFGLASAYLALWAGPFTPFFPLCVAITLFLRNLFRKHKEHKAKKKKDKTREQDALTNGRKDESCELLQ